MAVALALDLVLVALLFGAAGDTVAVLVGWITLGSILGMLVGDIAERRARRRPPQSPRTSVEPDHVARFTRAGTGLAALFVLSIVLIDLIV